MTIRHSLKTLLFSVGLTLSASLGSAQALTGLQGIPAHAPAGATNLQRMPVNIPNSVIARAKAYQQQSPVFRSRELSRLTSPGAHMLRNMMQNAPQKTDAKTGPTPLAAAAAQSYPTLNFPGFLQADAQMSLVGSDVQPIAGIVSVDANKDGASDIVDVQSDGTLNVLLNPGTGKLKQLSVTSTVAASSPGYVIYARALDVDGDGYPDIVATDIGTGGELVYLNKKDGTFAAPTVYPISFQYTGSLYTAYTTGGCDVLFGDMTGDGTVDMLAFSISASYDSNGNASSLLEEVIYPGKAGGGFSAPLPEQSTTLAGIALTFDPGQNQLADINGDGNLDFIAYTGQGPYDWDGGPSYVLTLTGDGKGKFTNLPADVSHIALVVPAMPDFIGGLLVQDIDGDGVADILTGSASIFFFKGHGDGTFDPAKVVLTGLAGGGVVNFADINGDGALDVVDYYLGTAGVYFGDGHGGFASSSPSTMVTGAAGLEVPMPADLDGDGVADLIAVDADLNTAAVFLSHKGSFHGASYAVPVGESPANDTLIAVGDYNGDGSPDFVFGDSSSAYHDASGNYYPDLKIGVNDGKGNFSYKVAVPAATLAATFPYDNQPFFKDLNGDGIPDILWTASTSSYPFSYLLEAALSNPDGSYQNPQSIDLGFTPGCPLTAVSSGDVNGDQKLDLIMAYGGDVEPFCNGNGSTPSGIIVLLNDGTGKFTASFIPQGTVDIEARLADFNNDGKLDIVALDGQLPGPGDTVWVIPGNGDGTFNVAAQRAPFSGTRPVSIITGDADGDGKQDITLGIWDFSLQNPAPGTYVLKGNGDFTFGFPEIYGPGTIAVDGDFADFNGDGLPDLALTIAEPDDFFRPGFYVSSAAYFPAVGGGAFGSMHSLLSPASDEYDEGVLAAVDFNGDGAIDILNESLFGIALYPNQGALALSLASSANSVVQGSAITLTATLTPSISTELPTGTVTFYNNGTLLQIEPVSGSSSVLNLSSLPIGANSITATYSGDPNFNGATATALEVDIQAPPAPPAPTFTLSPPSATTISVNAGSTATFSMGLSANATFNGDVALSCSGAPAKSTCSVTPATVTLAAGQTSNAVVVLTTTASTTTAAASLVPIGHWLEGTGVASLAGLVFLVLPGRTRKARFMWLTLPLLLLGAVTTGITGCGSSPKIAPPVPVPGTPTGNATLTITAVSGSITQTQTVTVTVQ